MAKKLKDMIKKNPVANPTFGTDPSNPWATKYNVTEATEAELLARYLNSRGINPHFVPRDTKIAHAKSAEYAKWKADHTERFAREEVQLQEADKVDTITVDIPLMIRLLEYAREDAKTDMDLHKVTENLIDIRDRGVLTMADYEYIVSTKKKIKEGFDDYKSIAKELVKRHGKNVTKQHIKDIESERDSRSSLDHDEVMAHVKKLNEAKKPTALDKFRKAAAEREKKHAEIEKKQSKDGSGMTAAIDRLEKHLNKEEVEQIDEVVITSGPVNNAKKHGWKYDRETYGGTYKHPKHGHIDINRYGEWQHRPKSGIFRGKGDLIAHGNDMQSLHKHIASLKEEVEQIDELKKDTLKSYRDKSMASFKNAKVNRSAAEPGKNMSKGFADLYAKSDAIAKKRAKGLAGYLQRKHGMKPGYSDERKATSEDAYQDTYAATQMPFDGANTTNDTDMKREMSKSARIIKSIYKRKNMKEELADWEKEDKSVQTYGKKPKLDMTDKKSNIGENKPEARAVMTGGKTLTGQDRDMVEIDPSMKNRPDRPDTFDKGYPKKSPA